MEVSSCCEQSVCRRVQTCFAGVLNYADDEANTYNLHCYIVGDTKQRASQRNQQQGTTCNTGSTASGDSCYEGQQDFHCKGNFHAQCVYASQCHNCDCDCSTAHVDCCIGSEIDDPDLIRLIESCGALVVADRYCYGSFPGRQEIVLTDGEDALTQVCRWYLQHTECPRQSALHRVQYRNDHVAQLVHDFKADGAIYEQMKFCTYWSYERVIANQVMPRDYGIHILSIDRPYIAGQSGQLRTRVQAFVESLEMKQLRSAQKEDN